MFLAHALRCLLLLRAAHFLLLSISNILWLRKSLHRPRDTRRGIRGAYMHGDYLLFTEADTVHGRDSIDWAVTNMEWHRADCVSGFVFQEMNSLGKQFIMPATCIMSAMVLPERRWLSRKGDSPGNARQEQQETANPQEHPQAPTLPRALAMPREARVPVDARQAESGNHKVRGDHLPAVPADRQVRGKRRQAGKGKEVHPARPAPPHDGAGQHDLTCDDDDQCLEKGHAHSSQDAYHIPGALDRGVGGG